MNKQSLTEFAKANSWHAKMSQSQGLDSYKNYSGTGMGDLVVVAVGRNRDSEIMDESNFDAALEMLGGESKTVIIERFGHWGCGWFELILVDPRDKKALKIARDIELSLKNYPLLDEDDYSEREYEYQSDYAKGAQDELANALAKHFALDDLKPIQQKALVNIAYELNIWVQGYAGNDACINVYDCREPDESDIARLHRGLCDLYFSDDSIESQLVEYLIACTDLKAVSHE